jgi:cell fate (sporulation/competence/biofilm development) regulator YlbF (YheA/YmcA/DUF963 family)
MNMNPNELPQNIQDTARALSEAILSDPQAKAYQDAVSAFEANPEAVTLEKRFMDFYNALITRQQNGEKLEQQEVENFYAMRTEYSAHPLIIARNDALGTFKPLLAEAGEQINAQLGLDFTELAKIE